MPHECGPTGGPKDGFRYTNWCWKLTEKHRKKMAEVREKRKSLEANGNQATPEQAEAALKEEKAFGRTRLAKDIAKAIKSDDPEEILAFRGTMQEIHQQLANDARAYNEAFDELVDNFIAKDAKGRRKRTQFIAELSRADDPTDVPRFDEIVQYVRDNPRVAAVLGNQVGESSGIEDLESLVFEGLKQGKQKVPGLNSEAVWDATLEWLEAFGGPVELISREELEAVEFSMKFWKEIIRPDTYHHTDPETKEPTVTTITAKEIDHWHKSGKQMLKSGLNIPVPYFHTDEAQPVVKDKIRDDVRDTAAYVVDYKKTKDGALWAQFDPVSDQAEKQINNEIRHVSIRTDNFKDGSGKKWPNVITHVAACHNGVMKDQKPFVPEHGLALSLSMCADDGDDPRENSGSSLETAIDLLRSLGIELGDDTTPENFIDRLCTAARAVAHHQSQEGGEEDFETRPEGSKTQKPAPIAMSNLLQFSLHTIQKTPNNPATGNPWTESELKAAFKAHEDSQPKLQLSASDQAAFDLVQRNNKLAIQNRVEKCVKDMTMPSDLGAEICDSLNDVTLQFSADGSVDEKKHSDIFRVLKQAEGSRVGSAMNGASMADVKNQSREFGLQLSSQQHPRDFTNEATPEEQDEVAKRLASYV